MSPLTAGFIFLAILFVLMFAGLPIGVSMGLIGVIGYTFLRGFDSGIGILGPVTYSSFANYTFSCIPLFILMGEFCFHAGLSRDLYDAAHAWFGKMRGGLAMATVAGCAGFAAICGSSMATAATMGAVALPEMRRYKYGSSLAAGCVAAGGTIGILIPPSIIMIIYGVLTATSVAKLFLAGFLPGILQAILFLIAIWYKCKRNPGLGPPGPASTIREKIFAFKKVWMTFVLFLLIIGGLYAGVFTPTEAGGIGAFLGFIFLILKGRLSWQTLKTCLFETIAIAGMTYVIYLGAMIIQYFLAVSRLPFSLADILFGLQVNRYVILILIMIVYLGLGCVMDSMAMVLITIPIFFPLVMKLGFDPVWFGVIIVIVVELGMITPPIGMNVFVIHGMVEDIPMYAIFNGVLPFIYASVFLVVLLTLFPQIALILPAMIK
jgi:C4-dicarboxylate transporter DctM subunit